MPTASMNAMSPSSDNRFSSDSITDPPTLTSTVEPEKSWMYGSASVSTAAFSMAVSVFCMGNYCIIIRSSAEEASKTSRYQLLRR